MTKNLKLPKYKDDEVRVFHPYFEAAMRKALKKMGIETEIELIHHWSKRGFAGIIDFVLLNPSSNKILLAMELKKTPSDLVRQGRRQARNYLENLGTSRGSDFYLASNLERVELFKHSKDRPITSSQLVKTAHGNVGTFDLSIVEQFFENLVDSLIEVLELIEGNDGTLFASNVIGLLNALEVNVHNEEKWRFAILSYLHDFVRGALAKQNHAKFLDKLADEKGNITPKIISEGFTAIGMPLQFSEMNPSSYNQNELSQIVAGAFEAGADDPGCDELSSIVNEFGTNVIHIPGAIETDFSLAKLMVIHTMTDGYSPNSRIIDPGSGTGNLICAALEIHENIDAASVTAIENSYIYVDLLQAKLNLRFAKQDNLNSSTIVLHKAIEETPQKVFKNANIVLMNPPFIRGIDSVEPKNNLRSLLKNLHHKDSKLTTQQLGYECGLLEFITHSVSQNCEFGTIFTKNSLTRSDSVELRKFLISEFGLHTVISYPTDNLFGGVQKETVILAGRVGAVSERVNFVKYDVGLESLNFEEVLTYDQFKEINSKYFEVNAITTEMLLNDAIEGWKKYLLSEDLDIASLFEISLFPMRPAIEKYAIYRGSIGNTGASDLLFNPRQSVNETLKNMPQKWESLDAEDLEVAAKNSDVVPRILKRDTGETGFYVNELGNRQAAQEKKMKLSKDYVASLSSQTRTGVQRRRDLGVSDVQEILSRSKPVSGNLVLVPRAQRAKAQISISINQDVMISTNFLIIDVDSILEANLLGSWLLSLFGQIQLEALGINQEGMRKIEKAQLQQILVPDFSQLSTKQIDELVANFEMEEAMNLDSPKIRQIDELWARILVDNECENYLETIFNKFVSLCSNR